MNIALQPTRPKAVESQKAPQGASADFLAQAGAAPGNGSRVDAAAGHRRLLEVMQQDAQNLGFSTGELLANIGQNFNPDLPLHPRQALAAMMLAYEEGLNWFQAGDPQVSLSNLTALSNAVNEHLTSIQNRTAKTTATLAEAAGVAAGFVRSMSVGMAGGIAAKIGGPPMGALVGGLTSVATLGAMAGSAQLQGIPLEQLDLPNTLINDAGNLLTTIGAPHLMAFFNLPVAPTANTMRGIAMHMVRQGGVDGGLDALFVAFTEAALKKQPIPDALRAGAVQGVFSFLTGAGLAGVIGGMDAAKSANLGKMIEVLEDNDVNRLISQFSPAEADALRRENPIVYRALNGRTDGALDDMLNVNPRGAQAQGGGSSQELELVEVEPGAYEPRRGSTVATASEAEGLNRRPNMSGSNQASRPASAGAATPVGQVQMWSSPDNPNVLTLNGDEFVIGERNGKLIVTVPGGDDFTFPEGMTVDQAKTYFENVWLTGVLPDHAAPRTPLRLGDADFTILGAEGLFGVETPRGDFHRFEGRVESLDEAATRARGAWFNGDFDGYGPPRTTVNVANAELVIVGGGDDPFFLKQADGAMIPLAATTEEQAVQIAGQRWLRGAIPGSPPPVSRLTLDPHEGQVATILGGGQGPFAVGDRNGNYIMSLANADGSPVTSLSEASELAKQAFERGALASHGYRVPDPASALALTSAPGGALALDPDLPDLKNPSAIMRWTREQWSAEDVPEAARRQMELTLGEALEAENLDPFVRDGLERALNFVRVPQTHPDPGDVFGILRFVGDNWSDQLADLAPPAIRDQMYRTLYEASLSTDPALRDVRDKIRHAMSELHASGARAFPNLGDVTFGTGIAEDLTELGTKLGVPDGEFLGLNTRGHPVFQTPEGGRVGPFYAAAGELATEAKPTADADPLSLWGQFWKNYDVRIGGSFQITDQLTGDPLLRSGAGVGRDTFTTIRDAFRPLAPGTPPRPGPLDTFFKAMGFGARIGENLIEPRIVSRVFLDQIGLQGLGANSALQFKVATLENEAVQSLRGQPSAFNFRLAGEDPVDLSVPGKVTVRGSLALNVDPTANGVDAFGNTNGQMFITNHPIPIDKTMRELYMPKLELFGLSTPGMEYREESAGPFFFPEDTVVPEAFVQIVNRRVGNSPIEVTMPGDFPNTEAGRAAALAEIQQSLAGEPSFISEIPAEEIKGNMVGGYAQRISSVPGSAYTGANNLDINFLPGEGVVNDVLRGIQHLSGREYQTMPFERSLPGVSDPVNAILDDAMHGYNKKVRIKVDIPFVRADIGPVKLRTAFYLVRERQEDMRTALMSSNERAMLGFASEMGSPREVAVPTWLATMVSASGKPGQLEAELGMIPFPAGGIVVPPGGVQSLRGFLMDEFQDGTDAERQAIMSFLGSHMNGAKGRITDNKTLMPQDRDDLIELLHTISNPVQALPGD